uniref:Uncharacterized protein n=1 Tax=Rhizophora mucronata TaxID=61149 RepID=A0A2P2PKG2_RHIMU
MVELLSPVYSFIFFIFFKNPDLLSKSSEMNFNVVAGIPM